MRVQHAERILEISADLEARLREMGGQVAGPLLIGASTTIAEYLLPGILGEFAARHPELVRRLRGLGAAAIVGPTIEIAPVRSAA